MSSRGRNPNSTTSGPSAGKVDHFSHNIELSKALSWLLRHNVVKEGLAIDPGGWVKLDEVLQHKKFLKWTVEEVKEVVERNDKQRFSLRESAEGKLEIRANQGHTIKVQDDELLEPVTSAVAESVVIHGTYQRYWDSIRKSGLSRMNRNHIHFAAGEPGTAGVISGMRSSCQIYIYVDLGKAMENGIKFFRSTNNVILSPGNEDGFLESKYFFKVLDIKTGKDLLND